VVTPAAYLLFYRRRSERALGSPQLQRIVERALDGDADSDDTMASRSASPANDKSGNDGRVDDYSSSSTALIGPVAAPPREGARSAGASTEPRRMDLTEDYTDLDELPDDHGGLYDEGIALSSSVEFSAPAAEQGWGSLNATTAEQGPWASIGFRSLGVEQRSGDDGDDMDSNAAQGSEEEFGGKPSYGEYDELPPHDMELVEGAPRISSTPVNEESDIPQQSIEDEMDFRAMQGLSYHGKAKEDKQDADG
jgi:ubiquitin carboxyl-terminal hydrolase 4/11/15